jgi:hypothetical protein
MLLSVVADSFRVVPSRRIGVARVYLTGNCDPIVYEYSRFIGKPILNETRDDVFTTNNATGDDGGNKTDDNSDRGGVVVNSTYKGYLQNIFDNEEDYNREIVKSVYISF